MIANIPFNQNFTLAEKFILERALELTHPKTLDSYRVKFNNPKTALQELFQVLNDWKNDRIKHFDTVNYVKEEVNDLLKSDDVINYKTISKDYFYELVKTLSKEKYRHLLYSIKLVLNDNENYFYYLVERIKYEINNCNNEDPLSLISLQNIEKYISYFVTELIEMGFSKSYIHEDIYNLIRKGYDFESCINIITTYPKDDKEFYVYYKSIEGLNRINILQNNIQKIENLEDLMIEKKETKSFIKQFMSEKKIQFPFIFGFKVRAKDPFASIKAAGEKKSILFDNLKLGFPDLEIEVYHRVLIIEKSFTIWPLIKEYYYKIDGRYKSNKDLYEKSLRKVSSIIENKSISRDSKEKITSAIRHLRQGNENLEIEQKYLNYWIGLEYLFSNYDKNISTINRIKDYLPSIHSVNYIKRLFREFLLDRNRLIQPKFDISDTNYKNEVIYKDIINEKDKYPLLAFRSYILLNKILKEDHVKDVIENHYENLKRHIVRIYRIRNEIVHEAAKKTDIESITSNLKFYLTYILNGLIDFLSDDPLDINDDGEITIEDYFIIKKIEYDNLKRTAFKLNDLFNIKDIEEIFT